MKLDIHIREQCNGNILVDIRDEKGVITDIIEYEKGLQRSLLNALIEKLLGSEYKVRKV